VQFAPTDLEGAQLTLVSRVNFLAFLGAERLFADVGVRWLNMSEH
jgi:hypothetical protein